MKLTNHEIRVLKELYNSYDRRLEQFTLFKRIKITFIEMFRTIEHLEKLNLINVNDMTLLLTDNGVEWIVSSKKYSTKTIDSSWKNIPDNFIQPQLKSDSFYIPNITLLDKTLRKDTVE